MAVSKRPYSNPVYQIYIANLKLGFKLIQKDKYIWIREPGLSPTLEFAIEEGYIRNSMT